MATLVALIIGLLVSSAKSSYDTVNASITQGGAKIITLNYFLSCYGPEAKEVAAIRHVHGHIEAGMSGTDIHRMMADTIAALGGKNFFALVLLNEASAYPHGTEQPQTIRECSTVLIDTGCTVHGYSADISRTWVFGSPSARQREVWDTVKRGQELALETAKIGVPVGDVDRAVRAYYEGLGWARDYGLPGTSHRTGHGIGMDGHEPPNLMRADRTPLQAGMCFSDEPGIYIPGEFGIRMEDCRHMTGQGPGSALRCVWGATPACRNGLRRAGTGFTVGASLERADFNFYQNRLYYFQCFVNLSTARPEGRGSPFDKLKALTSIEGLEVHSEPRLSTPPLKAGLCAAERAKKRYPKEIYSRTKPFFSRVE